MTDIELIASLGNADQDLDHLDKELAHLRARIPSATVARDEARAALEAAREALAKGKEAERATARDVAAYVRRRATAVRALETGLGDADAAERQVSQCDAIIDELETFELEQMEAIEAAQATVEAAEASLSGAEAFLEAEQEAAPPLIADRQAVRDEVQARRDLASAAVPVELRKRYDLLRGKKRVAVVEMRDGYCLACRVKIPLQEASDVNRLLLKACHQCGRWLMPSSLYTHR